MARIGRQYIIWRGSSRPRGSPRCFHLRQPPTFRYTPSLSNPDPFFIRRTKGHCEQRTGERWYIDAALDSLDFYILILASIRHSLSRLLTLAVHSDLTLALPVTASNARWWQNKA